MPRYAYLMCELKSRDLDARLLVAAQLIARGMSVVVGQQWSMNVNAGHVPPGVFLFKSANSIQVEAARKVKTYRHRIVFMDEEVLAVISPYIIRQITGPGVFDVADVFLFQSETHREILNGSGPVVGSLRVDLLRDYRELYQAEADEFKRDGRYLLINTNYGLVNNAFANIPSILETTRQAGSIETETAEGRAYIQSWIDVETRNKAEMEKLIGLLQGKLGDVRIVLRSHPTENPAPWTKFPDVRVVSGSAPTGWLLGAEFIVHTNSTTGMEAALLEKPVLNMNPKPNTPFSEQYVMNHARPLAADAEEAATYILDALSKPSRREPATWLPTFPPQCATLVADEIAARAIESPAISRWDRLERSDPQIKKFTVSPEEFVARLKPFLVRAGVASVEAVVLDDSVFLLKPENA